MANLTWQIGEFLALATLGGRTQKLIRETYAGIEEEMAYGDHPQQKVYVYIPLPTAQRRKTIVYFVHGGGWSMGNPGQYRFVGRFFAGLGYPTILAGYRLVPGFIFPTQLEDVVAGLRAGIVYLNEHATPVNRIVLGGHSAGANLASLLTYDQKVAQAERPFFKGLFPMSGSLDFSSCQNPGMQKLLRPYIGHLPDPEIANPIHHAQPGLPISVLCIHGAKDPLCVVENSTAFAAKLNQGPVQGAKCHIISNKYHSDTLDLFIDNSVDTKVLLDWLDGVDRK